MVSQVVAAEKQALCPYPVPPVRAAPSLSDYRPDGNASTRRAPGDIAPLWCAARPAHIIEKIRSPRRRERAYMANPENVPIYSAENRATIPIYPLDVFCVTDKGTAEIHSGSTALSPEVLELLVLVDGKANVGDIEQLAGHIAPAVLRDLLRSLLRDGLLRPATIAELEGMDFSDFFSPGKSPAEPSAGASASADREAESGAPELQKKGYYVSIARHAAAPHKPADGSTLSVLVIEDDPLLGKLLLQRFTVEGYAVRVAENREQILAALRSLPLPDLVLLDVLLPDANGFDVLQRMKQHPKLRTVPVIMLTGQASRAAVMRGLVGGADGYITKPFDVEILVKGVKAVLGVD